MRYEQASETVATYRDDITALREKIRAALRDQEPQPVEDYEFTTTDGPVKLSDLFGDRDTLFVVHNMGAGCSYCTLWADGLNGVIDHLSNRATFVVASPDAPETQRKFAEKRGWRLRMVSHAENTFAEDMGYKIDRGFMPGVSVFRQSLEGGVMRVSDTVFGPGDDFCSVWHLFDLIPEGVDGWQPKFKYAE